MTKEIIREQNLKERMTKAKSHATLCLEHLNVAYEICRELSIAPGVSFELHEVTQSLDKIFDLDKALEAYSSRLILLVTSGTVCLSGLSLYVKESVYEWKYKIGLKINLGPFSEQIIL